MVKKVHVIINPAAGQDRPILGILNGAFRDAGIEWEVFITHEAGDATRLAKEAVAAGVDCVAVHGGDGTVMEVAAGVMGSDVPMAIIPGGTANVMSVELGVPGDAKEACKLICDLDNAQVRKVDMGQVGDQYFMLRVGMGFEAALVEGADRETKNKVGTLAYILSGLQALANPVLAQYHLTLDGKKIDVEGITCMVANSGSLGTPGLRLAPNIDVGDGWLDVVVVRKGDLGSILSVVASVVAGNENAEPLQHWQAKHVTIESDPPQSVQADGEIISTTPVEVKVLPHALKVLVPRPPEATEAAKLQDTNTEAGTLGAMPAMV